MKRNWVFDIRTKVNGTEIMFFCILVSMLSYLYLIDNSFEWMKLQPSDLALLMTMAFTALMGVRYLRKDKLDFTFGWFFLAFVVLIGISSLQSTILFKQRLIDGIIQQRTQLIWCFAYFGLSLAIREGELTVRSLMKMIRIVGYLELFLFILQYFVGEQVIFLYVNTGVRYDEIRYFFLTILLDLLFFLELDDVFDHSIKGVWRLKALLVVSLILFEIMFVQKYRLTVVCLLACTVIGVFVKRMSKEDRIFYVVTGIAVVVFLFSLPMFQDIFVRVVKEGFTDPETFGVRNDARMIYSTFLLSHPLFGAGYPYCREALEASGFYRNYYLGDNGVFGLIYVYGLVGATWIILFWIKLIGSSVKVMKKTNCTFFLLFFAFFVLEAINEAPWYYGGGMCVFVLAICLMESFQRKTVLLGRKYCENR